MDTSPPSAARQAALDAAAAAGALAREQFLRPRVVSAKGQHDIVTEVDVAAEELIVGLLRERFPADGILAEERGRQAGASPYLWVVDPLDGTHNYAAQLPFWCVSVARYNTATGQVDLGVVADPLHDEVFVAERGAGAWLNGRPLRVAPVTDLRQSLVACDLGYVQNVSARLLHVAVEVQPSVRRLRLLGSAVLALAYVACGRIDAFFHLHLMPWDLAAAWLVVEEAGGRCTDWQGAPLQLDSTEIVAAAPGLHAALLARIAALPAEAST